MLLYPPPLLLPACPLENVRRRTIPAILIAIILLLLLLRFLRHQPHHSQRHYITFTASDRSPPHQNRSLTCCWKLVSVDRTEHEAILNSTSTFAKVAPFFSSSFTIITTTFDGIICHYHNCHLSFHVFGQVCRASHTRSDHVNPLRRFVEKSFE